MGMIWVFLVLALVVVALVATAVSWRRFGNAPATGVETHVPLKLNMGCGNNKLAGFRHLALRVDSLDTAKAELEKRGVKFTEEIRPAAGAGNVLFFADGEGNLLHLVERPANFKW